MLPSSSPICELSANLPAPPGYAMLGTSFALITPLLERKIPRAKFVVSAMKPTKPSFMFGAYRKVNGVEPPGAGLGVVVSASRVSVAPSY